MTVIDSTFPEGDYSTLQKKIPDELLSLNEIVKESLKKAQAVADDIQLVFRSENLPQVKADRQEMNRLFDDLMAMILNRQSGALRQFLYVDCEEEQSDIIDMTLEEGYKRYSLKFHTNISTHENWKLVNSQALINCRQILSKHNGNLVVNDISSAVCLFAISLPGKIE